MADELHDALKSLAPTPYSDIPLNDLPSYLTTCFTAGELIVNSIPPPLNGEPFPTARPHHSTPNPARSAKDMHVSLARPSPPHESHEALQKYWGKPYKFSAAANPYGVALYKMAGQDRHGAWFARRSVHEGIGFSKFRRAMQDEFPHTLTVQGGPGAGAIRGLSVDSRLEDVDVAGVGHMEVYLLSGQMPKPVTPREFVQVLMCSEDSLTEKSASHVEAGRKHVPRSYMIVSKPTQHPEAGDRSGFVRGQYESVEMIREIPLHRRKGAKSTPNLLEGQHAGGEGATGRHRGATVGSGESHGTDRETDGGLGEADDDAELNPVEWIMVTRSDPGGGIPRFLVDRGTPDAMLGDIGKFLDWAASQSDGMQPVGAPQTTEQEVPRSAALSDNQGDSAVQPLADTAPATESDVQQQGGLISNVTQAVGTGITAYAPTAVTNQLHDYLHPTHAPTSEPTAAQDSYDDDSSDSSSDTSFMSAAEMRRLSTAPETQGEASSLRSATSSSLEGSEKKNLNSHEKEVQKLMRQREKLDRKLANKREEEEQKMKKAQDKDRSEEDKQRERHEKDMQKAEDRHRKEIGKLEAKKEKEARKAEEKRRKKDDRLKLGMVSRERDEVRREAEALRKENGALAGRVEELERENRVLVERLGGLGADGGKEGKRSLESLEGKGG
ncbi:hypothetical protein B0A55_07063 [Friedmanniomyces simplex]|uniref:DUF3074 domain-containing protein n=1 Tax=Friedmanniomyces simplex TaxID=329884 RepID=A0A4U0X7R3_9PEZI|nr:hypothetical protein B0A55_07063 [Friedmanniomyces simplex]